MSPAMDNLSPETPSRFSTTSIIAKSVLLAIALTLVAWFAAGFVFDRWGG